MPYLGLVAGQTAKVYVANPLTGFSCQVQIKLVDTSGTPVATGQKVTLGPGRSTSLAVSGDAIASGGRTEIRPIVTAIPNGPCRQNALVSTEVIDRDGVARVFYPSLPVTGSPEKILHFGLIDLAQGQTARVIAVNLFPTGPTRFRTGPVKLRLRFLDGQGNTPIERTMTVAPGAAAFDFTLPATTAAARGGSTATDPTCTTCIRAGVSLVSPDSPAIRFLAGEEIFDPVTGKTIVAFYPTGPV